MPFLFNFHQAPPPLKRRRSIGFQNRNFPVGDLRLPVITSRKHPIKLAGWEGLGDLWAPLSRVEVMTGLSVSVHVNERTRE